jgi:hypothetical protein
MQGAISNIKDLQAWYMGNRAPFYILTYYSTSSSTGSGNVIRRNDDEDNLDKAWGDLESTIMGQLGRGRAQLHLIVWKKGKASNAPDARTNIDLVQGGGGGAWGVVPHAGIGGVDYSTEIEKAVAAAREKWELENRIAALESERDSPGDFGEKLIAGFERIASNPVGAMLLAKLVGLNPAQLSGIGTAQPASDDTDASSAASDDFDDNIDRTAQILGVTDAELAAKLRRFAESNPDMAKQLFQQV